MENEKEENKTIDRLNQELIEKTFLIGKNGRKVISQKFIDIEKGLLENSLDMHHLHQNYRELADMFKNMDDALEYKFKKILKERQEKRIQDAHENRFLNEKRADPINQKQIEAAVNKIGKE